MSMSLEATNMTSMDNVTLSKNTTQVSNGSSFLAFTIQTVAILSFAFVGNLFLIFVMACGRKVGSNRARLSPVQTLIMHNCASDLMFTIFGVMASYLSIRWPIIYSYNLLTCKLLTMISVMPMYASAFLLVAISADRFQAVCRPMASLADNKHLRPQIYAAAAWCAALVCSAPMLVRAELHSYRNISYCRQTTDYNREYVLYFATCAWLIPTLAASCFYGCVCLTVWRSMSGGGVSRSFAELNSSQPTGPFPNNNESAISKKSVAQQPVRNDSQQQLDAREEFLKKLQASSSNRKRTDKQMQQRLRTVKLTLSIVACNFILWAPFCVTSVIWAFDKTFLDPHVAMYFMLIGNLNICVNPWIYLVFNLDQMIRALTCGSRSSCLPSAETETSKLSNTTFIQPHHLHNSTRTALAAAGAYPNHKAHSGGGLTGYNRKRSSTAGNSPNGRHRSMILNTTNQHQAVLARIIQQADAKIEHDRKTVPNRDEQSPSVAPTQLSVVNKLHNGLRRQTVAQVDISVYSAHV